MLFEKIDRNSWKRNEYFEHYFANTPCTYSMTVKLDITPIKKKQLKLYPAMLYIKKLQDECFTQTCKNISAPNATVANVGKNKQISYTILPSKGIDTTITADVTDFEMGAVSINGVPLSLDMEIDDSELMNKIEELQDAVSLACDGANELADGLGELAENNPDLISGANDLGA